jgi:uncharacterized protein DUF695/regulator of ribonuclease activity B
VKYCVAIQTIIYCLLFSAARAQNEQWDTYMAKFGDKPGSVLVDMALMPDAPDRKYPNLVITGPRAHHCNSQGIPDKEEIDQMEGILDATNNFLTGVTPKILAGTFTYNCERLNYYYVKDTNGIRNALRRMYDRGYRDYNYVIRINSDPGWITYRTFLYPNDETLNWMENDKIISKMLQQGDSLTTPRNINFDLYFRSDTDRRSFANFATEKGYKADKFTDPKTPSDAYGLTVSKYALVKMDALSTMTAELKKEAKKHHGTYYSWEAKK